MLGASPFAILKSPRALVDVSPSDRPLPPPPRLPVRRLERLHLVLPVRRVVPALRIDAPVPPHAVDEASEGRPPGPDELVRLRADDLLDHPVQVLVDPLEEALGDVVVEEPHGVPLLEVVEDALIPLIRRDVDEGARIDHVAGRLHDARDALPRHLELEVVPADVIGVETVRPGLVHDGVDDLQGLAEDRRLVVQVVPDEPLDPLVHLPVCKEDERVEVSEEAGVLAQVDGEVDEERVLHLLVVEDGGAVAAEPPHLHPRVIRHLVDGVPGRLVVEHSAVLGAPLPLDTDAAEVGV
mmetsp:Transcript_19092/g.46862  ORF Transcript_19092/g.46862 Transcript_19092/m.46862 type:complete len:296 (+) Transcript_19092:292-1179(+)